MSVKILDHYKALEDARTTLITESKSRAEALNAEKKAKIAHKSNLEAEKAKKEKLLADVQKEGLDAGKLKTRIAELEVQIRGTEAELQKLQKEIDAVSEMPKSVWERGQKLTSVLTNCYKCAEAAEVKKLDDCWEHLSVKISRMDEVGRPIECKVGFGAHRYNGETVKGLKVRTGNHFARGFRPEVVSWLPDEEKESEVNGRSRENGETPRLYAFLAESGEMMLSRTRLTWQETRQDTSGHYGRRNESKYVDVEDDFSDIAISLETRFDEMVARENGELDLDKNYGGNRLMAHLRRNILAQTTSQPGFEPTSEELTTIEIYKAIKPHWDGLANCPWSNAIGGNLALLKFHVENGEKARFWVEGFKNHYGFRLRTRDHTWITGHLFVQVAEEEKVTKPILRIHNRDEGSKIARVGGMWLCVDEER